MENNLGIMQSVVEEKVSGRPQRACRILPTVGTKAEPILLDGSGVAEKRQQQKCDDLLKEVHSRVYKGLSRNQPTRAKRQLEDEFDESMNKENIIAINSSPGGKKAKLNQTETILESPLFTLISSDDDLSDAPPSVRSCLRRLVDLEIIWN